MIFEAKQALNTLFRRKGRDLPNTLIIGAQKAGTSSLFNYLSKHQEVLVSFNKEVHFFDHDFRYNRGLNWYKKQFPPRRQEKIILEATPRYLYLKSVPERVHEMNNHLKIVVMIRDPLARAYSAWNMYNQFFSSVIFRSKMLRNLKTGQFVNDFFDGKKVPDFGEMISREMIYMPGTERDYEPSLIKRGFYKDQILNWLQYYDTSCFHFIQMEDMKSEKGMEAVLSKLFDFLEIGKIDYSRINLDKQTSNQRKYSKSLHEVLSPEIELKLRTLFIERNVGLDDIIKQKISWLTPKT